MDDDTLSSGVSGWAWYEAGRARAVHDASVARTVRRVFARPTTKIDVNSLINQNQALAVENAQLRQDLEAYRHNYNKLKAWADDATLDLRAYRSQQG